MVDADIDAELETKITWIYQNGAVTILPNSDYDGMSSNVIGVIVPGFVTGQFNPSDYADGMNTSDSYPFYCKEVVV